LLLVTAAVGISLAALPPAAGVPLDPGIPNGRVLIARGLSGVPGPGQPTAPIAVDRVVTDGAATYVQFHSTTTPGRSFSGIPTLYGDTGALVNGEGRVSYTYGTPGWARLVPPWFPWRPPPGLVHGVATLGPLPLSARAAVLRFATGEAVRVPLNLGALRRVRAYASPLVSRAGLDHRVVAARDTSLVLGFAPYGDTHGATLTDAQGHIVPFRTMSSVCGGPGFGDIDTGLVCRQVWTYSPQRRGTRLTLTIRSFVATAPAVANAVGAGPWRLPVVIP